MTITATYSPDDNKLRLYASSRLDRDVYERVKAAGFKWAPKQELFVAPAWTPSREDLALELAGEIDDEDTSLVERAEERAERFEEYSESRLQESEALAKESNRLGEAMNGQPILVGHHSEKRHRRDFARMWDQMHNSAQLWRASEYWERRAEAAIKHAKYKELPSVRARRIKGLEAEQRKHAKEKADAEKWLKFWSKEGLTLEQARTLANFGHFYVMRQGNGLSGSWSAWDVLRPDGERYGACPGWTVEQVQEAAKEAYPKRIAHNDRWLSHLALRLSYERAMLAESGGTVAQRKGPEKGGAVRCWASPRGGWAYIQKVNKVSVTVLDNWGNGGPNFTRTIPFDKLSAVMTKAEVEAARAEGRLAESDDKRGFALVAAEPVEEVL